MKLIVEGQVPGYLFFFIPSYLGLHRLCCTAIKGAYRCTMLFVFERGINGFVWPEERRVELFIVLWNGRYIRNSWRCYYPVGRLYNKKFLFQTRLVFTV
jgi:hypothetical protein